MAYNMLRSFERPRTSSPATSEQHEFERLMFDSITEEDFNAAQPRSNTPTPDIDRISALRKQPSSSSMTMVDPWLIKIAPPDAMADMRTTTSSRSQMPIGVRPSQVEAIKIPIDTCFVQLEAVKAYRARIARLGGDPNVTVLPDFVVFCRLWPHFFGPSGLNVVSKNHQSEAIFACLKNADLINSDHVVTREFREYGKPVIGFEEILACMEEEADLELPARECKRIHWAVLTFHEFYHLTYQQFATIHNAYMFTDQESAELQTLWRRFNTNHESNSRGGSFFSSWFSTSPSQPPILPPKGNTPITAITRFWRNEEYLKFDEAGSLPPSHEHLNYRDEAGQTPFFRGFDYHGSDSDLV